MKIPENPFVVQISWESAEEFLRIDPKTPYEPGLAVTTYELWKGRKSPVEYLARCVGFERTNSGFTLVLHYDEKENNVRGNDAWGTSTITLNFANSVFGAEWDDDNFKLDYYGPAEQVKIIDDSMESRFPEGSVLYREHRHRERDNALAALAKVKRKTDTGRLSCEVCDFDFAEYYGDLGEGFIEAHHSEKVSEMNGRRKTPISALRLVCSNCHRMLHRGAKLLSIEELREIRQRSLESRLGA